MDERAAWGIQAYKEGDYETAVAYLEKVDRYDWTAQLYLAMSYYFVGRLPECEKLFHRIKEECIDKDVRAKAESAFVALRQSNAEAAKNTGSSFIESE